VRKCTNLLWSDLDVGTALLLDVGIVGLLDLVTCLYR
jgi:hypothetical protein